jgi:hypothetical protein
MLNEKLQASPWPGVFSVSLTYDQIAAYLKNDSRDEARDYLQLNGQLDDPYAEPMLRAGTTACVARITLADRVPYVAASPNSPERIYPISPSPITTNTSPTPSPTIKPQSDPNIIDTSNYWPKRGKSYLYKGYNYGSYSGGRQNPITGRMQLDILPASLCGIQGDNYRFTKSNPFMYWTPCISGSCDKTSPNSEMVFAYENYKTLQSQNTLISTMTLPFDTVVQPMEGIKGEKTGKPFLKDDATTLSNLTYAAFTRAQYANMEKNYPIVLKLPESTPIENKIISRSIESAQKRVEGNNFDTRKHLVDYDDVINRHRMAMYTRRAEVLRLADLPESDEAEKTLNLNFSDITVLIAAFNEENNILTTVKSIIVQKYPKKINIIVISDGSTDRTVKRLNQYSDKIKIIDLPKNKGKAAALNHGLNLVDTELVITIDAD